MLPYVNVTPEEVIAAMQTRFPKELEICVLTIQNQKLVQERDTGAQDVEGEPVQVGDPAD